MMINYWSGPAGGDGGDAEPPGAGGNSPGPRQAAGPQHCAGAS